MFVWWIFGSYLANLSHLFRYSLLVVDIIKKNGNTYNRIILNNNSPLLCCLPKVSLTTVSELYNEDDHTVNHHGFSRNVMGEDKGKVGACQNPILNDKSEQSKTIKSSVRPSVCS